MEGRVSIYLIRFTAAATGLLGGVGVGILVADGRVWPLVALPVLALVLWGCVRLLIRPDDRAAVGGIVALSFALHVAVAVVLFTGSLALGRGGFIPGDDGAYFNLASNFVRYIQGDVRPPWVPPSWHGEAYLFGTWVYLESAIFFIVGPEVLVPILLNGAFALVTALLVFDMARRLFDRRSAYVAFTLTAFYPSLVLWSSLNLKDALALLLIGLCLWSLLRFQSAQRWWPLALAFAVLVPVESLRRYLFVSLALLVPLVVALTPRLGLAARARWTVSALVVSALFLSATQAGVGLGPQLLDTFEGSRQAMGVGARTRFVEAPPVRVKEGDTFVVAHAPTPVTPPASAEGTALPLTAAPPTPSPVIVHVAPNTRIVVITPGPLAIGAPDVVYVRPGDIVVVGSAQTTPAPESLRRVISAGAPLVQLRSEQIATEVTAIRTITYFPRGLTYALLAPFPWQIERAADIAVVPEMLVWYLALAAAVATVVRRREYWRVLLFLVAFVGGMLFLFSLVEGNVGTLYRHRAMSLPWVLLLASPTLVQLATRVLRLVTTRRVLGRAMAPDAR